LAAGALTVFKQAQLSVECRVFGHDDQVIDGIQAEANGIKVILRK